MKLERSQNINTDHYWNDRYQELEQRKSTRALESTERFFRFAFLPRDKAFTVLDIGCGLAGHYHDIHKMFPLARFTGADISDHATEWNRRNVPMFEFVKLDIEKDPVPGTYDYIISSHTFEHLNDPLAATEKCVYASRVNTIICVPYKESWSYDPEHMHTFSETEPYTEHDYYLVEYMVPERVGGIHFRFRGKA